MNRDPYRIWISEIMLQQTRAAAVIPYYEKFLQRFPNVDALAAAPQSVVLASWSGLGYYSRARSLHAAAQSIVQLGGFPSDYETIRQLPGVGPYTAAAIASIAFNRPHAALDGNVMRVIARLRNDPGDIGSAVTRARFEQAAGELLDRKYPGEFNQAMMELGATVCLARSPQCLLCPVSQDCAARAARVQNQLPVKLRRTVSESIALTLAIVERRGRILLWLRPRDSRRMAGFWEAPQLEHLPGFTPAAALGAFRHSITHHRYCVTVMRGEIDRKPAGFQWIPVERLGALPLSTITKKALRL